MTSDQSGVANDGGRQTEPGLRTGGSHAASERVAEGGATMANPHRLRPPQKEGLRAAAGVGTTRRALIVAGGLLMGYAVFGATTEPGLKLGGVLLFLIAMVAGHDGLFMPVVIAAGGLVTRAGRLVRAAAIISLSVGVVALPFVLGYGRSSDNPSALPLRYGLGLILVLASIWAVVLATMLIRRLGRIRQNTVRSQKSPPGPSDG